MLSKAHLTSHSRLSGSRLCDQPRARQSMSWFTFMKYFHLIFTIISCSKSIVLFSLIKQLKSEKWSFFLPFFFFFTNHLYILSVKIKLRKQIQHFFAGFWECFNEKLGKNNFYIGERKKFKSWVNLSNNPKGSNRI